ncbi:MAG TPA: ABC transporter substrate-binding protein [Actinocrinis sp.]
MPRSRAAVSLALAGALAVGMSGCGTRLPPSAFQSGGAAVSAGPTVDGVSATSVLVGMIDSVSSPLGPDTFSGPMYGAEAYFDALNAAGGVGGRTIRIDACDDGGYGGGDEQCAHKLVGTDHVLAFAGNSIYDYAAAGYVSSQDVPDVGGEPISNAYDQYQHLYSIYGSDEPRDGTIGWNGKLYGGAGIYAYFKQALGVHVAGVVYYNQADSQRYADYVAEGLRAEGYSVVMEQIDFALPDWTTAVLDMKARGAQIVFDALDSGGNAALCQAVDQNALPIQAKVTTVESWDDTVPSTYASAPYCRNHLYATSSDLNYEDTRYPAVAAFRAAMQKYFPSRQGLLSEWELEGWDSAEWLTDAIASCGHDVTRACVERYVNRSTPFTASGLLEPAAFTVTPPTPTIDDCFNVARWQDSADGGKGGWVTQVPDMTTNCFVTPNLSYSP